MNNFLVGALRQDPAERASSKNVAILVSSCDKYSDLWKPFFTLLWRYWPDCTFPVYLLSNEISFNDPNVNTIKVGKDQQWASNLRTAITQMPFPNILYIEEESFLIGPVDNKRVLRLIDYFIHSGAGYLRLYPSPGPDIPIDGNDEIGVIKPGAAYRVSLQASVWKKETLLKLIVDGETGWDMEIKGSRRSDGLEYKFLSVMVDPLTGKNTNPPIPYCSNVTVKGKLTRESLRICEEQGIILDLSKRKVFTVFEEAWERSYPKKAYCLFRRTAGKILRYLGWKA